MPIWIKPEYLEPAALRWGGEQGKLGPPTVEVLVLERAAVAEGKAAVLARVVGGPVDPSSLHWRALLRSLSEQPGRMLRAGSP